MTDDDVWAAIADERVALADLLTDLRPEVWEAPSRCGRWRVKDVVAHLVFLAEGSVGSVFLTTTLAHPIPDRGLDKVARRVAGGATSAELVDRLRAAKDGRFRIPGLGPSVALGEVLVHRADIAGAADLPRHPADERLRHALDTERRSWFAFGASPKVRRLQLCPTDADWTLGPDDGPVVDGPGESLLMVVTGRRLEADDDVAGPGLSLIA